MSEDEIKTALRKFLEDRYGEGCSNNGCIYRKRGGIGTNAICQCGTRDRLEVARLHSNYGQLRQMVELWLDQ
jgi:hypothetical protein